MPWVDVLFVMVSLNAMVFSCWNESPITHSDPKSELKDIFMVPIEKLTAGRWISPPSRKLSDQLKFKLLGKSFIGMNEKFP